MGSDPLFIRLYLDEDFHPDLAEAIRQRGFDCQNTAEAGMSGRTDEEQLQHATAQGRCILSFNVRDFMILARQWAQAGRPHAGIVVTSQVSRQALGQLLGRILQMLNTTTADEIRNTIRFL
jgi:predicted nuclease of predicted toxin-antitoxin system